MVNLESSQNVLRSPSWLSVLLRNVSVTDDQGFVSISKFLSFSRSWSIITFVTRTMRQVPLVEQESHLLPFRSTGVQLRNLVGYMQLDHYHFVQCSVDHSLLFFSSWSYYWLSVLSSYLWLLIIHSVSTNLSCILMQTIIMCSITNLTSYFHSSLVCLLCTSVKLNVYSENIMYKILSRAHAICFICKTL
jgi:hypothetical protein